MDMDKKIDLLRELGFTVTYGAYWVYVDDVGYTWEEFMKKHFVNPRKDIK